VLRVVALMRILLSVEVEEQPDAPSLSLHVLEAPVLREPVVLLAALPVSLSEAGSSHVLAFYDANAGLSLNTKTGQFLITLCSGLITGYCFC
jgi:hypothetical protein